MPVIPGIRVIGSPPNFWRMGVVESLDMQKYNTDITPHAGGSPLVATAASDDYWSPLLLRGVSRPRPSDLPLAQGGLF